MFLAVFPILTLVINNTIHYCLLVICYLLSAKVANAIYTLLLVVTLAFLGYARKGRIAKKTLFLYKRRRVALYTLIDQNSVCLCCDRQNQQIVIVSTFYLKALYYSTRYFINKCYYKIICSNIGSMTMGYLL